jgi:hypothetical protein
MPRVTVPSEAAELRAQLREALAARLAPDGWEPVEGTDGNEMTLASFACPIGGEFAATVEYTRALQARDRPPVRITFVHFGVSYAPLSRLWPLLDDRPHLAALNEPFTDMPEWAQLRAVEVGALGDVAAAVSALVGPGLDHAIAFAQEHASVDALLAAIRDDSGWKRQPPLAPPRNVRFQ